MDSKCKVLTMLGNTAWIGSALAFLLIVQIASNNQLAVLARENHQWPDSPMKTLDFLNADRWASLKDEKNVYLLDIRTREEYAEGHVFGSKNIPLYELEMRAIKELPKEAIIVIYCGYDEKCEEKYRMARRPTPCTDVASLLQDNFGFQEIRILAVGRDELLMTGTIFSSYNYRLIHKRINS